MLKSPDQGRRPRQSHQPRGSFRPDPVLPKGKRAENADYAKSGYDKGHRAPANDFTRSVTAMKATFILTNAVPQKHGVNDGKWAQLEGA